MAFGLLCVSGSRLGCLGGAGRLEAPLLATLAAAEFVGHLRKAGKGVLDAEFVLRRPTGRADPVAKKGRRVQPVLSKCLGRPDRLDHSAGGVRPWHELDTNLDNFLYGREGDSTLKDVFSQYNATKENFFT